MDQKRRLLQKDASDVELFEQQMMLTNKRQSRLIKGLGAGLTVAMSVVVVLSYLLISASSRTCLDQSSVWSPLLDLVEYEDQEIPNKFDQPSIYRGPPTPEIDAAWKDLWTFQALPIPDDKLGALNRQVNPGDYRSNWTWQRVEQDGVKQHVAYFEVFHQLHCLDLVRQYTWRDYYLAHPDRVKTPLDLQVSPVGARMHTDHCIEALRIALTCHGDVTPYLIAEAPDLEIKVRADFGPHRRCRRMEPLKEFMREKQIHI